MNPDWIVWVVWPFGDWTALIIGPVIMLGLGWLWNKAGQSD